LARPQIPENDETFVVSLTSALGGSSVDSSINSPRLNTSASRAVIAVTANDAPVRFSQVGLDQSFVSALIVQRYCCLCVCRSKQGIALTGRNRTGPRVTVPAQRTQRTNAFVAEKGGMTHRRCGLLPNYFGRLFNKAAS